MPKSVCEYEVLKMRYGSACQAKRIQILYIMK